MRAAHVVIKGQTTVVKHGAKDEGEDTESAMRDRMKGHEIVAQVVRDCVFENKLNDVDRWPPKGRRLTELVMLIVHRPERFQHMERIVPPVKPRIAKEEVERDICSAPAGGVWRLLKVVHERAELGVHNLVHGARESADPS